MHIKTCIPKISPLNVAVNLFRSISQTIYTRWVCARRSCGMFIVLRWRNKERGSEIFPIRLGSLYWENDLYWTCRMDGSNENPIQQFSGKLEGMRHLRITFKHFGFCYAAYSVFSPEIYSY